MFIPYLWLQPCLACERNEQTRKAGDKGARGGGRQAPQAQMFPSALYFIFYNKALDITINSIL